MSLFTLHEDAPCLLRHSVVIADAADAADFFQTYPERIVRNALALQFLPASAVDQMAARKINGLSLRTQRLIQILPDHIRKAERECRSCFCKLFELFQRFHVEPHVFIERVNAL